MPVKLGAPAQASYEQPLNLMKDCHRRIEAFLEVLSRVASSPAGTDLDDERRRALQAALRYFREAAPRHTQDEEESLFPRLRQSRDDAVQGALDRVRALESDHIHANALHAEIESVGQRWLRDGQLPPRDLQALQQQIQELQTLYRQHIDVEDACIFPLAGRSLTADELASIGNEMKARRARI